MLFRYVYKLLNTEHPKMINIKIIQLAKWKECMYFLRLNVYDLISQWPLQQLTQTVLDVYLLISMSKETSITQVSYSIPFLNELGGIFISETPCTNSPCRNGGSCTVSGGGYLCSCPSGFTGHQCKCKIQIQRRHKLHMYTLLI